ncbi:hypothetical protein [Colwellia sp. MEBiC06753]
MKVKLSVNLVLVFFFIIYTALASSSVVSATENSATVKSIRESSASTEQNQLLQQQYLAKHQEILPKVAVADMFYGCNSTRKSDPIPYQIAQLIEKMDKAQLAEKLNSCLQGETPQSESALNFGLVGCFTDQLSSLPAAEREQKMTLVHGAIERLSREQRQKSFTRCVAKQAIKYVR